MSRFALALCCVAGLAVPPAPAQLLADTLFTWEGYAHPSHCRLRLYTAAPGLDRRHVVVLDELAGNRGPSTLDDARYLVERIGRDLGLDPADTYWIFHWGAFSFPGAGDGGKELFLRATFRWSKTHRLSPPSWRLVRREEVETYTDRQYR